MIRKCILLFMCFLLVSCAATIYTFHAPYPKDLELPDIMAAVISTLQDRGFSINLANEKIGIITTEWMSLTSGSSKVFQKVLLGSAETKRMRISINIDKNNRKIKMNPSCETIQESLYGAGAPSIVTLNEAEMELVNKIMNDLCDKCEIDKTQIEISSVEQ